MAFGGDSPRSNFAGSNSPPQSCLFVCLSALGQNGIVNSTKNPGQIATFTLVLGESNHGVAVGNNPFGIAFDGANVWVVNGADNTLRSFGPTMALCWAHSR
jgi:hypothetical protein